MEGADISNSYEEIRKKRVEDNLKHLENLGIATLSKTLLEATQREHKRCHANPKEKKIYEQSELRRSSRERSTSVSYTDQFPDPGIHRHRLCVRKSRKSNGSAGKEYTGRIASYKQKVDAIERAEILQNSLNHPSVVKTMVLSNVSSGFWLGLPSSFCKSHLPQTDMRMTLEDESGKECDAIYMGRRTAFSGGWRGFSLEHKLEDGDCLIFELTEPERFKIYIIKAIKEPPTTEPETSKSGTGKQAKKASKRVRVS